MRTEDFPDLQMLINPNTPAASAASKALKRRRVMMWSLVGFVAYVLIGFLILPPIIEWQMKKQLPAFTQRTAEVDQVKVNPFTLSLTIRGLALKEEDGSTFASFDEFYANLQLSTIFHLAPTFKEIRLVHPVANLIRREDGSFNFTNLGPTNAPPRTNAELPEVIVNMVLVTNAVVTVTDRTLKETFRAAYGPINMEMPDFTTRHQADGPYTFVATTDQGETFTWSGRIAVNPFRSRGKFTLSGIPPAKYSPYLTPFTSVRVAGGELEVGAEYRVNFASQPLELDVTNAMLELRQFALSPPGSNDVLLAIDKFRVADSSASLTGHVGRVGLVSIEGGSIFLQRDTNGLPTALSYITLPEKKAGSPNIGGTTNEPAPQWKFNLDEFSIRSFDVNVQDLSVNGPAELGLKDLALRLTGVSLESNVPVQLSVGFNWRDGGSLHLESKGTVLPPVLTNHIAITNLELAPLQPYVGQFLNVVLHSGGVSVLGDAEINLANNPMVHFRGDVGLTNFSASDTITYKELAVWENLLVHGIDVDLLTNRAAIDGIKFSNARFSVGINSNGVINLRSLAKVSDDTNLVAEVEEARVASATNAASNIPPLRLGAVVLEDCVLRATDDSLVRPFELKMEALNGDIRNIMLPGLNKADLNMRGRFGPQSTFQAVGDAIPDPQHLYADLKVAFTNTDLTVFSPYAEKFVGRTLAKGKLSTDHHLLVEDNRLRVVNLVSLDKLTFGAKVPSPDATSLPVKLAVGLLKDSDGRIDLDVPISGNIDSPDFSIGGVVLKALQNIILKVASSPFALLGALVGGGEELQYVEFEPGRTTMVEGQTNKLMQLAEALTKRPTLDLEITALYDPVTDVEALGREKVKEQMKLAYVHDLVARKKPAPALKDLVLEDDEYERLLRKAYREAFEVTPEEALREALLIAAATNSPATDAPALPGQEMQIDTSKGAALLARRTKTLSELLRAAQPQVAPGEDGQDSQTPQKTEKQLVREEMEQRLATLNPAGDDDLHKLMQERIGTVEKFLVETAGVTAERIATSNPDPKAPQNQSAARVQFTLE